MPEFDGTFIVLPIKLINRADNFDGYTYEDIAIITYILCYKLEHRYGALVNARTLLRWLGMKNYPANVTKIKDILNEAQARYLNITCVDGGDITGDRLKADTLLMLELKPEVSKLLNVPPYKRVPISNIKAIIYNADYSLTDLVCYYLLLSSARYFSKHQSIREEFASIVSRDYSTQRIADIIGISLVTAKKSIKKLKQAKLIIPNRRSIVKYNNGFCSKPTPYYFDIV